MKLEQNGIKIRKRYHQLPYEYVCGRPKKGGKPCQAPPHKWKTSVMKRTGDSTRGWGPCKNHMA